MPPRLRKHASGHSKRSKKRKFEESKNKEFGSMHRYVKIKSDVTSENLNVDTNNSDSDSSTDESADDINVENMEADNINYNDDVDDVNDVNVRVDDHNDQAEDRNASVNVDHGPKRDKSIEKGPKDKNLRQFSSAFYTRVLPNNERCDRECHQEQMSLILRYVNVTSVCVSVEESFLGFLNVDDTTGQGLFDVTQAELKALDIDINDVRG
ncbi:zinc finger MYM-type protein 1 [Tanacetum coccineum]